MFERLPLTSLKAFEAVARRGSAVHAASELFVTPGAVTRQIRDLEDQVGLRLFDRGPDGWSLTEPGVALARTVNASLGAMKAALDRLPSQPAPRLRIGCPRAFAAHVVGPRLPEFLVRWPACDLVMDGDRQDEPPSAEDLDLVIRYGLPEGVPRQRMVVLPQARVFPVCAPDLATRFAGLPAGVWPDTPVLSFLSVDYWSYWSAATDLPPPDDARRLRFSENSMLIEAAVAGAGVAIGHSQLMRGMLREGRLVQVGPAVPDERRYYMLLSERAEAIVRDFADWLAAGLVEAGSGA